MNLNNLPDITFADDDADTVKNTLVSSYETMTGRKLASADPIRLFLLSVANVLIIQRNLINYTGKMNLLAYAKGDYLDHLGALLDVERIPAKAAQVTVKYALSTDDIGSAYTIPKGTRVTNKAGTT